MSREYNLTTLGFYKIIMTFIRVNGYTPSIRGMCVYTGLSSPSSVQYHLNKLVKMGLVEKKNKRIIFKEK